MTLPATGYTSGMPSGRNYDVVIVGGGVVGCAIARRLSFTTASVALLEAAHDVGEGASKGNTGITTCGADCTPGTLEARLVRRSAPGWEALCASLDTPFERLGTLCVALTADDQHAPRAPAPGGEGKRRRGRDRERSRSPLARAADQRRCGRGPAHPRGRDHRLAAADRRVRRAGRAKRRRRVPLVPRDRIRHPWRRRSPACAPPTACSLPGSLSTRRGSKPTTSPSSPAASSFAAGRGRASTGCWIVSSEAGSRRSWAVCRRL